MNKKICFNLLAFLFLFNYGVYAGGSKSPSTSVPTTTTTITSNCTIYFDWGFGTEALNGAGTTYYCGNIPESQSYLYNNSPTSKTANTNIYYCEIKVASNDNSYSKTYTWKAGSSMTVAIPSNKGYKITVSYLERWASGCYSWGGNERIGYSFTAGYTYAPVSIFAKMKFSGYYK